jgi:NADH-quinone oxidoreductase subunit J
VVSALATVMMRNPIRNAVGLFVHVLSLAGLYISLSAHFLTAVQLIVYVGAVVVLFVFVIMLLGPASEARLDDRGRLPRAIGAGPWGSRRGSSSPRVVIDLRPERVANPPGFGTIESVGRELFGPAVIPFEMASVLLTAAIVGAFAVARSHHGKVSMTGDRSAASRAREAMIIHLGHYLALSCVLFSIGAAGFLFRRNVLISLMSIELMMNAVNLTFIAANRWQTPVAPPLDGTADRRDPPPRGTSSRSSSSRSPRPRPRSGSRSSWRSTASARPCAPTPPTCSGDKSPQLP